MLCRVSSLIQDGSTRRSLRLLALLRTGVFAAYFETQTPEHFDNSLSKTEVHQCWSILTLFNTFFAFALFIKSSQTPFACVRCLEPLSYLRVFACRQRLARGSCSTFEDRWDTRAPNGSREHISVFVRCYLRPSALSSLAKPVSENRIWLTFLIQRCCTGAC